MPPKKQERTVHNEVQPQFEQIQADHELFLQAFEKPTQIYRYLRARNLVSPIFLHRTLTYMQCRNKRKRNTRQGFKVDSIKDRVEAQRKKDLNIESYKNEFMNLTFTGFFDSTGIGTASYVDLELLLVKICHKKRKDVSSPLMEVSLGRAKVPYNPENATPSKAEAIAVGCDHFKHSNGHVVRSYTLLIRVTCDATGTVNGLEPEGPPAKRRRSHRSGSGSGGDHTETVPNGHLSDEAAMDTSGEQESVLYCAELVIYDRHRRCLLTEGDYEVALQPLSAPPAAHAPRQQASWETVMDGKIFNKCPTIKFSLRWNKTPSQGLVDSPIPVMEALRTRNHHYGDHHAVKELTFDRKNSREAALPSPRKLRIFYQFLYNNNTRQQTEARDDLHCPWCSLNCMQLFSLLKHLRTSHPRFNFTYVEQPKGARIDVSINDCYDGSYIGNPQDVHSQIGFSFSRAGPVRRTPVTHIVVYRPERCAAPDYSEFVEPDEESVVSRQFIQGHNRLYYHSNAVIPLLPSEIDQDSEDEVDPEWLQQKTVLLIDDFTDVNEGEKEVMKMWNLHVMRHNFIGDCQMTRACQTFVEEHGERLIRDHLCRNFIMHMCNLYDFGLIKQDVVHRTTMLLYKLRDHVEARKNYSHGGVAAVLPNRGRSSLTSSVLAQSASFSTSGCVTGSAASANQKRAFAGIHSSSSAAASTSNSTQESHCAKLANGSSSASATESAS